MTPGDERAVARYELRIWFPAVGQEYAVCVGVFHWRWTAIVAKWIRSRVSRPHNAQYFIQDA